MDNRSVREPLLISRPTASQQKALNQTVWNLREAITEAKPLEQIAGLGKAYLQLAANRQDDTPRLWNITDQTEGAPTLARLQTAPWYYLQLTDS